LFILQAIFNTALQATNETDLLNSSHPVISVYDGNPVQIYPKHEIHDIIPEGKKVETAEKSVIRQANSKKTILLYIPYGANIRHTTSSMMLRIPLFK
jgi:hypothetical protein